jgi:ubiquinone/menaquinone biosynthesis C-methylase UbiE
MPHEHGGRGSGLIVNTKRVVSLLVRSGDVFLDVGCGPGDYLKRAKGIAKRAVGIDRDSDSVEKARKRGYEAIIADASQKIPFEDSSVDSVLLANVLHGFIENKEEGALAEIARVLKKGGRFGVVEFHKNSVFGPPKEIKLSPEEVEELVIPYGFVVLQKEDVGLFNYMIVFQRE